jgi:hypothetical protein
MALDKDEVFEAIKELAKDKKTKKDMQKLLGGKKSLSDGLTPLENQERLKQLEQEARMIENSAKAMGSYAQAASAAYDREMAQYEIRLIERGASAKEAEKQVENLEKRLESEEEINDLLDEQLVKEFNLTAEQMRQKREQKRLKDGLKKYGAEQRKVLGELADGLGLTTRLNTGFLGSLIDVGTKLGEVGKEGDKYRKSFKKLFGEYFNFTNLILSAATAVLENTIKIATGFDNARAKLAGLTGAGHQFSEAMYSAQRAANLYGVSFDEAVDSTAKLVAETANFAKFSEAAQGELIKTSALMAKLGVDTSTSSAIFDFFNNNMGMTAESAMDATKQLAMMGNEIGISSAKITKDFQAALPTLAVYGKQSVEIFKNLAAEAKAANVEVSALLGIANQFDTFAGAAEGVGKLNALLGTQLSTTQMLMMTEDERIQTLREAVQAQGVAFEDMDRFTQKAVANAAGIKDINEAQKILGTQTPEMKKNAAMMEANANATDKLEKAVAKTVPIMTKFKLLATELVIAFQPMLETLGDVADWMTEKLKGWSREDKEFWSGVILWTGTGLAAIKMLLAFKSAFVLLGGAAPAAGAGVAGAITAVGTAITGVVTALSGVSLTGVGGLVLGAIGVAGIATIGIIGATMTAMANADAKQAEASAKRAEAQAKMADTSVSLQASSDKILTNFAQIAGSDFSTAISGMKQLITQANEFNNMSPQASATLENIALISVGKAKDSMTNQLISGKQTTIKNNVNNVFKGMKMELKLDNNQSLKLYVEKVAQGVVNTQ